MENLSIICWIEHIESWGPVKSVWLWFMNCFWHILGTLYIPLQRQHGIFWLDFHVQKAPVLLCPSGTGKNPECFLQTRSKKNKTGVRGKTKSLFILENKGKVLFHFCYNSWPASKLAGQVIVLCLKIEVFSMIIAHVWQINVRGCEVK